MNPAGTEPETRDNAKPGQTPKLTHSKILEAGDAPDQDQQGKYYNDDTSTTTTALLSTSGVYSAASSSFERSTYCWSPAGAFSPRPTSLTNDSYEVSREEEELATDVTGEKCDQIPEPPPISIDVDLEKEQSSSPMVTNPLPNNEVRHIAVTPPGQHFIGSDRWAWLPEDFAALDCVLCLQSYLCNPPPLSSSCKAASSSTSIDSFASTQWDGDEDDQANIIEF